MYRTFNGAGAGVAPRPLRAGSAALLFVALPYAALMAAFPVASPAAPPAPQVPAATTAVLQGPKTLLRPLRENVPFEMP
jgi:hypothetical protein